MGYKRSLYGKVQHVKNSYYCEFKGKFCLHFATKEKAKLALKYVNPNEYEDPTYVPIIVWGDQADRCNDRLKKGMPVYVEGRLRSNSWQAADGTKRSRLEVVASRVQFLVRVDASAQQAKNVEGAETEYVSDNDVMDDEEVPF